MKSTIKIFWKNLSISVLLISVNCCASVRTVHPEFKDYVEDFNKIVPENSEKTNSIAIGFEDFSKTNVIARCYYRMKGNRISVDPSYWKRSAPTSKYFTFLHEAAHCSCNAHHTEPTSGLAGVWELILFKLGIRERKGYLPDGCPASIMHPNDFGELCAIRHFNYYIKELRDTCRKNAK